MLIPNERQDLPQADWGELSQQSIPSLIDARARQFPFRVALSAQSYRGSRDRLMYRQLALHMRQMAAGLAVLGVQRGDRVAVYLSNEAGREAVLTALGCFALGAVVVPLNVRSSDEELGNALALVAPVLVVSMQSSVPRLRRLSSARSMVLNPADADTLRWPDPTEGGFLPEVEPVAAPHDLACLLFTSGTTSRAKAVMHNHHSMVAAGFAMGSAVGLGPADLYQGAFPFFTSSCLNLGCLSAWVHGAGFVMENGLSNAQRLRLIETECATVYHGVPSVIQFMLDESASNPQSLRNVRRVAYGGASMPAPSIDRITQAWPWLDQVQVWGMTESGPAGAWLPPHWLPGKAGLIGQSMVNCELRVVDEAGELVRQGETGELYFRGPSMAQGYFNDPTATAEAFRGDWLHTGDVVVEDKDGLLRFVDRKKDVINRGGLKVSSAAVEAALYRIPGVAEAAAVAMPHPQLGEEVAACIVAAPGVDLDAQAMSANCQAWLADYELPRRWFFFSALPKNPMGKVLKRELREQVLARI